MGLFFNFLITIFNNNLAYDQNFKSIYLIGIVFSGLLSYLLIAVLIKAFKINDIKLRY
jgi:putative peptidoglycan lipid II flippase